MSVLSSSLPPSTWEVRAEGKIMQGTEWRPRDDFGAAEAEESGSQTSPRIPPGQDSPPRCARPGLCSSYLLQHQLILLAW